MDSAKNPRGQISPQNDRDTGEGVSNDRSKKICDTGRVGSMGGGLDWVDTGKKKENVRKVSYPNK